MESRLPTGMGSVERQVGCAGLGRLQAKAPAEIDIAICDVDECLISHIAMLPRAKGGHRRRGDGFIDTRARAPVG